MFIDCAWEFRRNALRDWPILHTLYIACSSGNNQVASWLIIFGHLHIRNMLMKVNFLSRFKDWYQYTCRIPCMSNIFQFLLIHEWSMHLRTTSWYNISKLRLLEALIIYSAILTETSFIERSTWSLIVSSLSSSLRVGELSATCDCLLTLLLAGLLLLDCLVDGLLDGLMGVLVEGLDLEGLLLSDSLIVSSSSLLSPACKHPE